MREESAFAGGNLTRGETQERIDFLADVRNAALEPLWADTISDGGIPSTWIHEEPAHKEKVWPADRVVFMNDVYFCARDVVRLLLHGADMACGMDFDRKKLDQIPEEASFRPLTNPLCYFKLSEELL